jgi:phosphatidylserine decarboxylase
MKEPRTSVAREGYPFIAYAAFLTLVSGVLGYLFPTLVLLAVTTFILMFFRDPERMAPEDAGAVISPADGKIIIAELVRDKRFHEDDVFKLSIFMNVFNVHVNRVPFAGTIDRVLHVPGAFLAADNDKAHLKNEYCAVSMTTANGAKLTFVQIAGLIARRIVCRLEPGDVVSKAERFGLIRFGSRVDVYLPSSARPAVHLGQKVRAGESILAYLPEEEE